MRVLVYIVTSTAGYWARAQHPLTDACDDIRHIVAYCYGLVDRMKIALDIRVVLTQVSMPGLMEQVALIQQVLAVCSGVDSHVSRGFCRVPSLPKCQERVTREACDDRRG